MDGRRDNCARVHIMKYPKWVMEILRLLRFDNFPVFVPIGQFLLGTNIDSTYARRDIHCSISSVSCTLRVCPGIRVDEIRVAKFLAS